jgi:hypothetical protein
VEVAKEIMSSPYTIKPSSPTRLNSPSTENIRPEPKAISVDLASNFLAREHYETDPKKHFRSTAKADFKKYNLLQERKLNNRQVFSQDHQREAMTSLAKCHHQRATSPTLRITNPYFDSACPRSLSPIRNRGAWHL